MPYWPQLRHCTRPEESGDRPHHPPAGLPRTRRRDPQLPRTRQLPTPTKMARRSRHHLLLLLLRYLVVALDCKLLGYLYPPTQSC